MQLFLEWTRPIGCTLHGTPKCKAHMYEKLKMFCASIREGNQIAINQLETITEGNSESVLIHSDFKIVTAEYLAKHICHNNYSERRYLIAFEHSKEVKTVHSLRYS